MANPPNFSTAIQLLLKAHKLLTESRASVVKRHHSTVPPLPPPPSASAAGGDASSNLTIDYFNKNLSSSPTSSSSSTSTSSLIYSSSELHQFLHQNSLYDKTARTSHNELERERRAHLRTCMEDLKNQLNRITPGQRLTTLVILKTAKDQLHLNRMKNHHLKRLQERREKEHHDAVETYHRLVLRLHKLKMQLRRKRCSGSECSVATTLSDESEARPSKIIINKKKYFLPITNVGSGGDGGCSSSKSSGRGNNNNNNNRTTVEATIAECPGPVGVAAEQMEIIDV